MNNLGYMLLLSTLFGRREMDPILLCLLFGLPGMGATVGPSVPPPPPPPTSPTPLSPAPLPSTTPLSCATTPLSCGGGQPVDPMLMCLLFSGVFSGERRRWFWSERKDSRNVGPEKPL